MELTGELKSFKIVALDYLLDTSFSGELKLNVTPQIQVSPPKDKANSTGHCSYRLNIVAADPAILHISITGEGIYQFNDVPKKFAESMQKLCMPAMEQRLTKTVEQITRDFGINPLRLHMTHPGDTAE